MKEIRHRAMANSKLAPQTAKKEVEHLCYAHGHRDPGRPHPWSYRSMRIASSTQDRTHIHSKAQNGRPFGDANRKRRYNAGKKAF